MTEEKILGLAEKILELAAQFDDSSPEFAMSSEAVIAFARALIEARLSEDDDDPVAWMEFDGEGGYDFYMYRGNEGFQREFLEGNPSSTYRDWVQPLYRRPQPKARLTDEEIKDIHRETLAGDPKVTWADRVMSFAKAIEQKIWGNSE